MSAARPRPRTGTKPARRAKRAAARRPRVPAELLAAALRAQSEGVFIAGRDCTEHGVTILFANDSFCAMVGRPAADVVGHPHGRLHIDRGEIERLRRWLAHAHPGQSLVGEGFLARGDGTTLTAAWSYDPLFDRRGRLTHVVATFRDQTEKRRLQEALVHAQRLDAVGRLAGGVAHDFNNLISVINGYCEMLAAHVADHPQAMREVGEIHAAGRKAATLTQQLLAFSRRRPLNAAIVNLNTLVRDNAEILRRLVGDAGRLDLDLEDDLPNTRTDPAQFQQVILNLVLNARDALRDKGRILLSTSACEIKAGGNRRATDQPPGRYVVLSVADNGTGMDAETQKHLFEPFFTTKPEGKGTGLGLALVYGVVQQSGGFVNVRSALLVGSTFEVMLPVVDEVVPAPPPPVAPLHSLRGSESVLLVEDDDVVRKMVAGMLTADGYRVTALKSCADLGRDADAPRPVHLLVAMLSPEGERFARRLHAASPALRLLCIAQCEETRRSVDWLPAAHQSHLQKPYALSELLRAARKLLDA